MKKMFFAVLALSLVLFASCGPSTKEQLKVAQATADSLMMQTFQQQNEIADLIATLTEVSDSLDHINGAITVNNEDGTLLSIRERLLLRISDIQRRIEAKQKAIDDLQNKYSKQLAKNKELQKTIARMEGEIKQYIATIQEFEEKVNAKNVEIEKLSLDLTSVRADLQTMSDENEGNKQVVAAQDVMLNSGFYVIGTKKELKKAGLVKDNVFTAAKINTEGMSSELFKQIDIREVTEIPLGSKDAKVLSAMPETSYEIVKDYDKTLKLVIKDPVQFWSITRYLVVMI